MKNYSCFLVMFLLLSACSVQNQNLNPDLKATDLLLPTITPSITRTTTKESSSLPIRTTTPKPAISFLTKTPTPEATDCGCDVDIPPLVPPSAPVWSVPVAFGPSSVLSSLLGSEPNTLSWTETGDVNVEDTFTVDPSTGKIIVLPTSTPIADPYNYYYDDDEEAYAAYASPDKTYLLECDPENNETRLMRSGGIDLIGSIPGSCDGGVEWSPDGDSVAMMQNVSDFQYEVFIWSVEDEKPRKIEEDLSSFIYFIGWSPDSKKLLVQWQGFDYERDTHLNDVYIISNQGKLVNQFRVVDGRLLAGLLAWQTNEIIDVMMRDGWFGTIHHYYEWSEGIPLGSWYESHIFPYNSQALMLSPNQRWQVLDQYDYYQGDAKRVFTYGLYDFQEKKETILSSGPNRHIQFLGWSKDSQVFNLVNRPAENSALTSEEMPFGWLALNPESMTYTPVFSQALFVKYNPTENLAWVVFPAKRSDGSVGMDSAIYDIAGKTLSDRNFISQTVFYGNPAHGDLIPVEWSHDGEKLVYLDLDGNVILFSSSGQKSLLGKNLISEEVGLFPNLYRFLWSPDDRWLIVHADTIFWLLDLNTLE